MCASPSGTEPPEISLLRRAQLRLTPQRLAVVREILTHNHSTVGAVYEAVRQQFPAIALTTVYAILSILTERGLLRGLPFEDAVRYDVNLNPHANMICTRCRRITDLSTCSEVIALLYEHARTDAAFLPERERIDLFGLCSECQKLPSA
jgi:Fur family peroxide stress response transcriptional regulator